MNFDQLRKDLEAATPGPWQVCGTRHVGDLALGKDTRLHWVGPDDDAVAGVFFDMKTGRGFMDARLIARAPDLGRLALLVPELREALAKCQRIMENRQPDKMPDGVHIARAALAKLDALLEDLP